MQDYCSSLRSWLLDIQEVLDLTFQRVSGRSSPHGEAHRYRHRRKSRSIAVLARLPTLEPHLGSRSLCRTTRRRSGESIVSIRPRPITQYRPCGACNGMIPNGASVARRHWKTFSLHVSPLDVCHQDERSFRGSYARGSVGRTDCRLREHSEMSRHKLRRVMKSCTFSFTFPFLKAS